MKQLFRLAALFFFFSPGFAQTCEPPAVVANARSSNLFSAEQEMVLGELSVQSFGREFREIRDPRILGFVQAIGEKLVRHLPQSGLKFAFHLIDYPEANAFNLPGGHIFITRKLVAFANTEDEIAAVMAHELGHAAVHHAASDISEAMRKILKVTSLGDRKDVVEKFNLLIENARTKKVSQKGGHENAQQLEADRIGFYAMVAAGYDPEANFSFFDRVTESEGKTGSWIGDLFGKGKPEQKRLREIAQATASLPAACREGRSAKPTGEFLNWQAEAVRFRETERNEALPGLVARRELSPKLRSEVTHLAFTNDGRFLLVQDDFAISLIEMKKREVLFQIPAEGAKNAKFTPDNKDVIFTTDDLRFERWSIDQKKAVEARELVLRRNCWEHELSPNGNYLACIDESTTVKILDTKTGKKVWEKKEFYPLSGFELLSWLTQRIFNSEYDHSFFRIGFTPDSRTVVLSRSNKFRFQINFDGMSMGSENTALAVDLETLKPVKLEGELKKVVARPYVFIDAGRIVGMSEDKIDSGGSFSFPGGKRIEKFEFNAEELKRSGNSDFATIRPLAQARLGILDLKRNHIVAAFDRPAAAAWGNIVAIEAASGKIMFGEMTYRPELKRMETETLASLDLPATTISGIRAATVSDNFGWIALSSRTRGGIWNLSDGQRTNFTRAFDGAVVDGTGIAVAEFPRFRSDRHSLVLMNSKTGKAEPFKDLPAVGAKQYGRFLLTRRTTDAKSVTSKLAEIEGLPTILEQFSEGRLRENVTFEVKDWIKDTVVWTRDFKGAAPRYSFDGYSGRLIFYWKLNTIEAKAKLKEDRSLNARAESLGSRDDDYLIEVVDAHQKKTIGNILLETGKGSFFVGSGQSEGDWLILNDSEGRILAYSIGSGELKQRFFGRTASLNPMRPQLAVENFPGELSIYDLNTGASLANYVFSGKAIFVRFGLEGNRLFVLSNNQIAYTLDVDKAQTKQLIP